jgi:hypothetical protein
MSLSISSSSYNPTCGQCFESASTCLGKCYFCPSLVFHIDCSYRHKWQNHCGKCLRINCLSSGLSSKDSFFSSAKCILDYFCSSCKCSIELDDTSAAEQRCEDEIIVVGHTCEVTYHNKQRTFLAFCEKCMSSIQNLPTIQVGSRSYYLNFPHIPILSDSFQKVDIVDILWGIIWEYDKSHESDNSDDIDCECNEMNQFILLLASDRSAQHISRQHIEYNQNHPLTNFMSTWAVYEDELKPWTKSKLAT